MSSGGPCSTCGKPRESDADTERVGRLLHAVEQLAEVIREQTATINTLLDERAVTTVQKSAV